MDRQPVLRGELLELRPLRDDDFEALYAVASDPLIWEQHPSKERAEEGPFREWFAEAMASGGTLVAIDHSDGLVVGTSRFHCLGVDCSEIEIGWTFLARSHWGGPYNTEMKRLMLLHAFEHHDHVMFEVHSENFRSQRAVTKLGAQLVGTKEDALGRGTNVLFRLDRAVYAITVLRDRLRDVPRRVAAGLDGVADDALRARPGAGEWSAIEVAGHLVDKLTIWRERTESARRDDTPDLAPYDQDELVRRADYQTAELARVLDSLEDAAARFAHLVGLLDPAEALRPCVHGEYGRITLRECVTLPLGSIDDHLDQMRRAIENARR